MDASLKDVLKKEGYALVGAHSAVKLCHWLRKALYEHKMCYKNTFYGIESHRCLQMSPMATFCTQRCLFCWRYQGLNVFPKTLDDPEFILDESIKAQRRLLSGYKGNDKTDMKLWKEAQEPKHVAISLTGEPTAYPRIGEFVDIIKERNMTSFIVTNGTIPVFVDRLNTEPTLLYVTMAAPDEKTHMELLRPVISRSWELFNETLERLNSYSGKNVARLTMVKGWNMHSPEKYAALVDKMNPDYIELKAYMFVGYSRTRLTIDNMPSHHDIRKFAEEMETATGYRFFKEREDSRVVLLRK